MISLLLCASAVSVLLFIGLTLTGLWSAWQAECPLAYTSPNAPSKAEVLGTWMLLILAGHQPYAHVAAIRCDGVNLGLSGMRKVISDRSQGVRAQLPPT